MAYYTYYDSPIGMLKISGTASGVSEVKFVEDIPTSELDREIPEALFPVLDELEEYFAKRRKAFSVKLHFRGTEFQQKVWKEMCKVPYGQTTTYLEIALRIGDRNAVRAVGAACKHNPIAILGPCHRVIGTDGDLTGYNGGLEHKRDLLMLENPMVFGKQISLFK
ncbi:MAG: methylated-DNA--[protein]-cysteine S-methyltransferase [Bacteroidota bacterium]